jgi:hypothetical protein
MRAFKAKFKTVFRPRAVRFSGDTFRHPAGAAVAAAPRAHRFFPTSFNAATAAPKAAKLGIFNSGFAVTNIRSTLFLQYRYADITALFSYWRGAFLAKAPKWHKRATGAVLSRLAAVKTADPKHDPNNTTPKHVLQLAMRRTAQPA